MDASDFFIVNYKSCEYDIKKFLRDHPGGVNTLLKYKGKNVMNAMEKFEHSANAYHMMRDFRISTDFNDKNLSGSVSKNGRIITKEEVNSRDERETAFLEELEGKIDWSKPILEQLVKIAPHYNKWINSAVYRRCRLFRSSVLERLTYTPWYVVPCIWMPVILYLGIAQFFEHVACKEECSNQPISLIYYLFKIVLGLIIWSALEYTLHRWVFHLDPGSSLTMIKIHFLIHGLHHKTPFDGLRQVFPPVPAVLLTGLIYAPFQAVLSYPRIVLVGGLIGYLTYDMIHYYVHHGSPAAGTYLYAMKRYHSNHHFVNHDKAFGISNKFWDYVFKTFVQVKNLGFNLHW